MNNRVDKLKKKMDAKRKRRRPSPHKHIIRERDLGTGVPPITWKHAEEREETLYTFDDNRSYSKPVTESYFRKDRFLMQVLASICLFFVLGIVFQSSSHSFDGVRNYVQKSFQEDFQFDVVASWYEEAFGRPLALLPPEMDVVAPEDLEKEKEDVYALPATGTVRQSFAQNGRGIYVETEINEQVEAVRSGMVRFVGEDEEEEWGKVIVVRHYDGGESWYGMLDNISVQLYDHVDSGDILGEVSPHADKEAVGVYYFALKEGETFVDPIEVISFD